MRCVWDAAGVGAKSALPKPLIPYRALGVLVLGWQSYKPPCTLRPKTSPARVGNWQARRRAASKSCDHQHAIAAKEDLLLGPLGHAPLDRRRGQVELVVQRLLHQIQERALDGAEDHLLEVCVAQQSM